MLLRPTAATRGAVMGHLSPTDAALVATIYNPPRARTRWMLDEVLPSGARQYYSLARWALLDALKACGVGAGDRVLVPGLICREVLAPVHLLGAVPVFYPVSPQLAALPRERQCGPARAIVAVNYFGFAQDLESIREYCGETGAALIEDNAHGLFSRDTEGRVLGSRGAAGVFSFRKTIAVPGGAALVMNGGRLLPSSSHESLETGMPASYRLKQGFRRAIAPFGAASAGATIAAIRQVRRSLTGVDPALGLADAEQRIPTRPNPPRMLRGPIDIADPAVEGERRRSLYQFTQRVLEDAGATSVYPGLPSNVVPYGYPMFAIPSRIQRISTRLSQLGLPFVRWPDLPAAVVDSAPDHYRQLYVVPFLW